MKGVTKAEWLQKGLEILETEGAQALLVERLARALGISKSGFYWHFKDREDLRTQIVDYWTHEFTEVVTSNPNLRKRGPRERLRKVMEMILDHDLTRYETVMRVWAEEDPAIARRVFGVYRQRMDFIRAIFREMGFGEDDAEMRTRLFLCYHTWERSTFKAVSKKALRRQIPMRLALLTRK
jgi:AcrR family transcriptional regulator